MKISLVSVFQPFRGGIAQFSKALSESLHLKNEVQNINFKRQYPSFLFPGKTQFIDKKEEDNNFNSIRVIDSVNPLTFKKTSNVINQFHPDILIVSYWMTFFGFCKGFITKNSKVKTKIALIHNFNPHEAKFYDKWMNKYFIKQFDGAIVMSEKVKNDVKILAPKMKILSLEHPNYTHFGEKVSRNDALDYLKIPNDKKVLLFFGLIRDYKGLETLIKSLVLLPKEYFLVIAGESYGDFSKYQYTIDENNLSDQILLHNRFIGDDEVKYYFSGADVLVLPYKEATQSGVIAISNHFCLPAIASNVGGLPQMIKHDEEGLISKVNSSESFANVFENYFENDLKSKFTLNLKTKKEKNSWQNFANKIVEFSKVL